MFQWGFSQMATLIIFPAKYCGGVRNPSSFLNIDILWAIKVTDCSNADESSVEDVDFSVKGCLKICGINLEK